MLGSKRQKSRDEALEQVSSPEGLDQLIRVIRPMTWVNLITLGSTIGLVLVWSILGRIPITVTGKGMLVQSEQVGALESPISSQLQSPKAITSKVVGVQKSPGTLLSSDRPDTRSIGITYFAVKDGKKIKEGMEIQITPDTVKRTRFGSIIGTVTSVSTFPVTTEEVAANFSGNFEVARFFISEDSPQLEVRAKLKLDPSTPSGYKWSSSVGPSLNISDGTTVTAIVKIEERAPITFLLPILRE